MLIAPWLIPTYGAYKELSRRMLETERLGLQTSKADICHRFKMLELEAQQEKLKGNKRRAARLEVEVVSLKVELEDIERQIAEITKKLEEEKSRSECRLPLFPPLITLA